ncbi:MAG TPA: hypothetical protein PLM53_14135 [Spirochaetota bacterium]|nr:hypothetical protein [Spirochaetota bacterium]HPC41689.1 hypothetical protein [Spirochaetota bacterium]HPL15661.1 hypothetical protein [Spirochaetota bacterium]HQF09286.1 hypothetical protein [Spirochaetota bacterium]HQH98234.1 hypothetical protein [Spirochaetota bacterium]
MIKKLVPLSIIAVLCVCGCGKYGDVKSVIKDIIKATDACTADMQKANSGKEAAVALDAYTAKMSVLRPKMNEYFNKYPELRTSKPKELEKVMEDFKASNNKFFPVLNEVIMKYKGDKDFGAAMENMNNTRKKNPYTR